MSIHGQRLPVVLIQEASGACTPVTRVLIQQCQQSEISNIELTDGYQNDAQSLT